MKFLEKHNTALLTLFLCLLFTQPVFARVFINGNDNVLLVITAILVSLPLCYAMQCIHSKWAFLLILLPLMMLSGTEMFLIIAERDFARCANIMAALTSPPAESKNFMSNNNMNVMGTVPQMFWALFAVIIRFIYEPRYKRVYKLTVATFVLSVIISFATPVRNIPPYNLLNEGSEALYQLYEKETLIPQAEGMTFGATRPEVEGREIYVLGVGESMRADHLSLNGYERETTPQLQSFKNLVSFSDYYSTSTLTLYSVPVMLTRATVDNFNLNYTEHSIIVPYKECGFKTFAISTGKLLTYDRYLTRGVDSVFNVKNDTIAPMLIDSLSRIYPKTFFIVQLYQCHMYYENFRPEYNVWHPNHISEPESTSEDLFLNAYDNDILNSDDVMADIIRVIDQPDVRSTFFFASDHGEELNMHGQQRGMGLNPRVFEYWPAMFFWYNDKWAEAHEQGVAKLRSLKDQPVNSEDMFYTACQMGDITLAPEYEKPEWSLLSPKYTLHPRRVILPDGITLIDAKSHQ